MARFCRTENGTLGLRALFDCLRKEDLRPLFARSWSLSWPMTLIMTFEFLIGLTDVYVAGRIGKEVQAAYGFVIQLYFIFIIVANALTVGTVSIVSRVHSSGDRKGLAGAVLSSLTSAAAAGGALALAGLLLAPALVGWLNIPEALKPLIGPFIRIYAAGLLFHYIIINTNGVLRSCGRVKDSLRTMALVCGANVALNLLFFLFTPLGYRGIALATCLSVTLGGLLNLGKVIPMVAGEKRPSLDLVKQMFHIGWPMGVLQVLWQLGAMALFLILSTLPERKVEVLAALTTGLRIESAIFLPAFAFNMANAVIIGNLLGEKKDDEAFKAGLVTALTGLAVITVLALAVVLNARWISSLLSPNPIVIEESARYLYVSMMSEPVMAWGIILGGGLSGAGDTRAVLLRVSLSVWIVRIPLCLLFVTVLGWGPVSVWWAMNFSQFVQAFFLTKRYLGRGWLPG
jgi:multidrug resistance protein, MATE family